MKRGLIDDSLWFHHSDGSRFYPWIRFSKRHGYSSFWVSEGSNHIADATSISTVAELVQEVFAKGRRIWLCDGADPGKWGLPVWRTRDSRLGRERHGFELGTRGRSSPADAVRRSRGTWATGARSASHSTGKYASSFQHVNL